MKYFIIAGEASGDIHGASLIASLRQADAQAQFRFLGGDMMAQAAGTQPIIHYNKMAYMGFVDVVAHLATILGIMRTAKQAIEQWRPDALILIDYPSFNLRMSRFAHQLGGIKVFYFISPKVWVWKEHRVKAIKRYVDAMYCILPFEPPYYWNKHHYRVTYVGNPTVKEIAEASRAFTSNGQFLAECGISSRLPIIAIVPGSRVSEIRNNLPVMVPAAMRHAGQFQAIVAGAPSISRELYAQVLGRCGAKPPVVFGKTFELVRHARAAIVTSGTATLETALLGTPQVACYRLNGSKLVYRFYSHLLHGKYVTLPNLITNDAIIPELLLHYCTPSSIDANLSPLLNIDSPQRAAMLAGYSRMKQALGTSDCTAATAKLIVENLSSVGEK